MTLGWYIHHHGRGHLQRFLNVQAELGEVTVLSSLPSPGALPGVQWRELPLDVPVSEPQRATATADGLLHWAPIGAVGYRQRMASIAAWIAEAQPQAVVVDVSVEVALLVRLMGVRPVWVAQHGLRSDPPHQMAFAAAGRIIAPWTAAIDTGEPAVAARNDRTDHVGLFSRFDARAPVPRPEARRVCVLLGFGGHHIGAADIAVAAAATPDWHWEVTGVAEVDASNVTVRAPDDDVWEMLSRSAVVVSSASTNAIAEVAAARRPLICLPQQRPFDEQVQQARALGAAGLVHVEDSWPTALRWPGLLEEARTRDTAAWSLLHDGAGAPRFAQAVRSFADS